LQPGAAFAAELTVEDYQGPTREWSSPAPDESAHEEMAQEVPALEEPVLEELVRRNTGPQTSGQLAILVGDICKALVVLGMPPIPRIPQDSGRSSDDLEAAGVALECLQEAYASGAGP
jgi:hypothetical protein